MSMYARQIDGSNMKWGIFESYNCEFVNPENLGITEEMVNTYLEDNEFPKSNFVVGEYNIEDMINDVCDSSGSLIIGGTKEQADWISDMIWDLI